MIRTYTFIGRDAGAPAANMSISIRESSHPASVEIILAGNNIVLPRSEWEKMAEIGSYSSFAERFTYAEEPTIDAPLPVPPSSPDHFGDADDE
jgi:hypothetical protein